MSDTPATGAEVKINALIAPAVSPRLVMFDGNLNLPGQVVAPEGAIAVTH